MVLPVMCAAAGMPMIPSMLLRKETWVSLVASMAGVAASVPTPEIGQIAGLGGLSVLAMLVARLVEQVLLCQSELLSLCTPKLEPPTTSR